MRSARRAFFSRFLACLLTVCLLGSAPVALSEEEVIVMVQDDTVEETIVTPQENPTQAPAPVSTPAQTITQPPVAQTQAPVATNPPAAVITSAPAVTATPKAAQASPSANVLALPSATAKAGETDGAALSGTVLASGTRTPLAGIRVSILLDGQTVKTTTTSPSGTWTIDGLLFDTSYTITLKKEGHPFDLATASVVIPAQGQASAALADGAGDLLIVVPNPDRDPSATRAPQLEDVDPEDRATIESMAEGILVVFEGSPAENPPALLSTGSGQQTDDALHTEDVDNTDYTHNTENEDNADHTYDDDNALSTDVTDNTSDALNEQNTQDAQETLIGQNVYDTQDADNTENTDAADNTDETDTTDNTDDTQDADNAASGAFYGTVLMADTMTGVPSIVVRALSPEGDTLAQTQTDESGAWALSGVPLDTACAVTFTGGAYDVDTTGLHETYTLSKESPVLDLGTQVATQALLDDLARAATTRAIEGVTDAGDGWEEEAPALWIYTPGDEIYPTTFMPYQIEGTVPFENLVVTLTDVTAGTSSNPPIPQMVKHSHPIKSYDKSITQSTTGLNLLTAGHVYTITAKADYRGTTYTSNTMRFSCAAGSAADGTPVIFSPADGQEYDTSRIALRYQTEGGQNQHRVKVVDNTDGTTLLHETVYETQAGSMPYETEKTLSGLVAGHAYTLTVTTDAADGQRTATSNFTIAATLNEVPLTDPACFITINNDADTSGTLPVNAVTFTAETAAEKVRLFIDGVAVAEANVINGFAHFTQWFETSGHYQYYATLYVGGAWRNVPMSMGYVDVVLPGGQCAAPEMELSGTVLQSHSPGVFEGPVMISLRNEDSTMRTDYYLSVINRTGGSTPYSNVHMGGRTAIQDVVVSLPAGEYTARLTATPVGESVSSAQANSTEQGFTIIAGLDDLSGFNKPTFTLVTPNPDAGTTQFRWQSGTSGVENYSLSLYNKTLQKAGAFNVYGGSTIGDTVDTLEAGVYEARLTAHYITYDADWNITSSRSIQSDPYEFTVTAPTSMSRPVLYYQLSDGTMKKLMGYINIENSTLLLQFTVPYYATHYTATLTRHADGTVLGTKTGQTVIDRYPLYPQDYPNRQPVTLSFPVTPGESYFMQVVLTSTVENASGPLTSQDKISFVVNGGSTNRVILRYPLNGQTITSTSQQVTWDAIPVSGITYTVTARDIDTPRGGEVAFKQEGITGTTATLSGLAHGKTYEVTVEAFLAGGTSTDASAIYLTVAAKTDETQAIFTDPPTITLPETPGKTYSGGSVPVEWTAVEGASAYVLRGSFGSDVVVPSTDTSYTLTGVEDGSHSLQVGAVPMGEDPTSQYTKWAYTSFFMSDAPVLEPALLTMTPNRTTIELDQSVRFDFTSENAKFVNLYVDGTYIKNTGVNADAGSIEHTFATAGTFDVTLAAVRGQVVSAHSAAETITVTPPAVQSIALSGATALRSETGTTLTATVLPAKATQALAWTSSDDSVATVTGGRVTAAAGITASTPVVITATATDGSGIFATHTINILPPSSDPLVETIVITGGTAVQSGNTTALSVSVTPPGAPTEVVWTSLNPELATVDENGVVTAVADLETGGTAVIQAAASDGSGIVQTYSVAIAAAAPKVQTITVTGTNTLQSGGTLKLTAAVAPADAAQTVTWTSGNLAAATINDAGFVTALTVTENTPVVFTATATDSSGVAGTFTVTITPPPPQAQSITITGASELESGKTAQLTAIVSPLAASQGVTWTSQTPAVATVDANGLVTAAAGLTAEATVTIVATAADGSGITKEHTLTVSPVAEIIATGMTITGTRIVFGGGTTTLRASFTPDGATAQAVTWQSSNPSVAAISDAGVLTTKAVTTPTPVVITATSTGGSALSATHSLTVVPQASSQPLTITLGAVSGIKTNDATVTATVQNTGGLRITGSGLRIGTNAAKLSEVYQVTSKTDTSFTVQFAVKDAWKALASGTTYSYQIFVVADGVAYVTSTGTFTTTKGSSSSGSSSSGSTGTKSSGTGSATSTAAPASGNETPKAGSTKAPTGSGTTGTNTQGNSPASNTQADPQGVTMFEDIVDPIPPQSLYIKNRATWDAQTQQAVAAVPGGDIESPLASSVMLARNYARLLGREDWAIPVEEVAEKGWVEQQMSGGETVYYLRDAFSIGDINIREKQLEEPQETTFFAQIIENHPEGFVVQDENQQAVFLTDYTDGAFYCSDPSDLQQEARIPLVSSTLPGADESEMLEGIQKIWTIPCGQEDCPCK